MTPEHVIDVVSPEEVKQTVQKHLDDLNLTREQLFEQARRGLFSSEDARYLWMAIKYFAKTA